MVYFPAMEALECRRYVFYVGEPIQSVSFWIQYDDSENPVPDEYTREYPIWANTRGQGSLFSSNIQFGDGDEIEPSDEFWTALSEFRTEGDVDVEECEFYEKELLSNIAALWDDEQNNQEIMELVRFAEREVEE